MNRIKELFERKKSGILSVFYTAGFPNVNDTEAIAVHLEGAGVDMIEIGIPFSDPIADGPTIQESNKRALQNGMNVKMLLKQVESLRKKIDIPVVLMSYLNPVLQYGPGQFLKDASQAGADGIILPDLPFSEYTAKYKTHFADNGLLHTFLVSPTTREARIREIDAATDGFIYAVSASSTTGARTEFSAEQVAYFGRLKALNLKNPFLVGFGISNKQTFATAASHGAGVIVGSAFIKALLNGPELQPEITRFVASLR